jgi:hypothetical protein
MTRLELLTILIARARANGFEFRRWYTARLGLPWIGADASLRLLAEQRRYYALLFSHEFAFAFWKAGEEIVFTVPAHTYQRSRPDGTVATIHRKPFQRRSARKGAWLYHLREMAAAEEPLRYMRRYLNIADELTDIASDEPALNPTSQPPVPDRKRPGPAAKPFARPIPTDVPTFLRRPYP